MTETLITRLNHFIESPERDLDEIPRRQARLLSSLLLLFLPLALLIILTIAVFSGFRLTTLIIGGTVLSVFGLAFFISRTRHFQVAGYITVAMITCAVVASIAFNLIAQVPLTYLSFSSLIAVMILSARSALVVSVANIGVALVVSQLATHIPPEKAADDLAFLSILTLVVWITVALRHYDLYEISKRHKAMLRLQEQKMHMELENQKAQLLSSFVQEVSHDLKTPISVITTSTYILTKKTDEEHHKRLGIIRNQAEYMTQVIEDLVSMTRLDEITHLTLIPVDVTDLLTSICDSLYVQADKKRQTLTVDLYEGRQPVAGEAVELRRCFTNLIQNAIRYTAEKGTISVESRQENNTMIVQVEDNGTGIDKADMAHIFERFYRSEKTRKQSGSGLGLAIVQRVVELHNGTIEVNSTPGQGTCFTVKIPLLIEEDSTQK